MALVHSCDQASSTETTAGKRGGMLINRRNAIQITICSTAAGLSRCFTEYDTVEIPFRTLQPTHVVH